MLIAFSIILLDMVGFGIMIPIMAFYALQLGADADVATFCMALYAIGMFISTPILGRMSDYYGRKPVLIVSLAGAVLGYILLGFSETIVMVGISRFVSGLMAGNIAAAQAYMTDVSSEQNRAKAMGLIGAAFGLGFIIGPALGSYLAGDSFSEANLWLPAMVSASLSFCALIVAVLCLKESLSPEVREKLRAKKRLSQWRTFMHASAQPLLFRLLAAGLVYNIAAGLVEVVFPIWAEHTGVAAGPKDLIALLLAAGVAMVIVQGGAIGPLTRRFGEQRLLITGASIFAVALGVLTIAGDHVSYWGVMVCLMGQSVGAALVLTPLQSLVSKCADPSNRGAVMGVYSSMGTLGRSLGTVITGVIFVQVDANGSYYLGVCCMVLMLLLTLSIRRQLKRELLVAS